eukprot:m.7485 g.7485  ORF g.7485 m.7485 type:complete len:142 (+) comp5230_c0_seq1:90-515(+)
MASALRLRSLTRGVSSSVRSLQTSVSVSTKVDRMIDPTYPEHSDISAQLKTPWGYWNSQDRRNFNEPLDENDDIKTVWVVDEQTANGRVSPKQGLFQLMAVLGMLTGVYLLAKGSKPEYKKPVHGREFPLNPENMQLRSSQ